MNRVHAVVDSPVGELTLVAAGDRLAGVYMEQQRHRPPEESFGLRDETPFAVAPFTETARQLEEYFDGRRTEFDLPLHFDGTEFQRSVWTELSRIPFGETVSYAELAARIGKPSAVRAVGAANGRNPISIIVPCHRVIGSGGSLTGYGGGLPRKQFLLAFEGVPGQLSLG
ncbi:methylated-DNA--[protein]-cysteine S-methyltransferase [Amycolatopsis sp. 195334CR]|uniref:methylated-DNA--[protein]-cysteine S-methyltransferase n=1 Tax=Amycolatopsis sp. 195334CR TaxID=2814588 RepID=UPI001A8D7738|nr:methylated-DNA--[protein]-cysteine S-methyltransferase [Amycolatopsis sp. 195334CR]MBN6040685.1 methylated-DNA--[protein]-cysteine S-methyltransferase [Amycolatopsis sp. 195334CR]